jgi:hypothetical protein
MESVHSSEEHKSESQHARLENKRLKEGTGHSVKEPVVRIGGDIKFEKNPKYIEERKKIFDELWEAQCNKYKGKIFHLKCEILNVFECRDAKETDQDRVA